MQAFVAMAFQDSVSEDLYRYAIKPICERLGLKAVRADEIFSANVILDDIVGAIENSKVIIADITGRNANVFYELGISHTLKRNQSIMITRDPSKEVPFDIAHFRIIRYDNTIAGKAAFEHSLEQTIRIIMGDPRIVKQDEYKLMQRIFEATNVYDLLNLVARRILAISPEIGSIWCWTIFVPNRQQYVECVSAYQKSAFRSLDTLGLITSTEETINLTSSGEAFADLLIQSGYQCAYVNGRKLDKQYSPSVLIVNGDKRRNAGEKSPSYFASYNYVPHK
jgi:hypothetical protein